MPKEEPKEERPWIEYLMTVSDVAAFFNISEQTVRLWIHDKKLKAYRIFDGVIDISPDVRKSTLYITRDAMAKWAEVYFKL